MNHVFYITFGVTIFSTLALVVAFLSTRISRATMQRIREVTHRGRSYRRDAPVALDAGGRLFTIMQWGRPPIGPRDRPTGSERGASPGCCCSWPAEVRD